jgi:hypothetical protein
MGVMRAELSVAQVSRCKCRAFGRDTYVIDSKGKISVAALSVAKRSATPMSLIYKG